MAGQNDAVPEQGSALSSTTVNRAAVAGLVGGPVLVVLALGVAFWIVGPADGDEGSSPAEPVAASTSIERSDPVARDTDVGVERPVTTVTTATTTAPTDFPLPASDPEVLLVVGRDIQPGRYLATDLTFNCYWERVSGLEDSFDEVIVNGLGSSAGGGGHLIVDVLDTDAGFRTQGCGEWRPYTAPAAQATSMGDGDWLVGSDIQPGTYRSSGPSGVLPCAWERASGFAHDLVDEVIDYGFPEGPATVELRRGERFTADTCGTWTLQ